MYGEYQPYKNNPALKQKYVKERRVYTDSGQLARVERYRPIDTGRNITHIREDIIEEYAQGQLASRKTYQYGDGGRRIGITKKNFLTGTIKKTTPNYSLKDSGKPTLRAKKTPPYKPGTIVTNKAGRVIKADPQFKQYVGKILTPKQRRALSAGAVRPDAYGAKTTTRQEFAAALFTKQGKKVAMGRSGELVITSEAGKKTIITPTGTDIILPSSASYSLGQTRAMAKQQKQYITITTPQRTTKKPPKIEDYKQLQRRMGGEIRGYEYRSGVPFRLKPKPTPTVAGEFLKLGKETGTERFNAVAAQMGRLGKHKIKQTGKAGLIKSGFLGVDVSSPEIAKKYREWREAEDIISSPEYRTARKRGEPGKISLFSPYWKKAQYEAAKFNLATDRAIDKYVPNKWVAGAIKLGRYAIPYAGEAFIATEFIEKPIPTAATLGAFYIGGKYVLSPALKAAGKTKIGQRAMEYLPFKKTAKPIHLKKVKVVQRKGLDITGKPAIITEAQYETYLGKPYTYRWPWQKPKPAKEIPIGFKGTAAKLADEGVAIQTARGEGYGKMKIPQGIREGGKKKIGDIELMYTKSERGHEVITLGEGDLSGIKLPKITGRGKEITEEYIGGKTLLKPTGKKLTMEAVIKPRLEVVEFTGKKAKTKEIFVLESQRPKLIRRLTETKITTFQAGKEPTITTFAEEISLQPIQETPKGLLRKTPKESMLRYSSESGRIKGVMDKEGREFIQVQLSRKMEPFKPIVGQTKPTIRIGETPNLRAVLRQQAKRKDQTPLLKTRTEVAETRIKMEGALPKKQIALVKLSPRYASVPHKTIPQQGIIPIKATLPRTTPKITTLPKIGQITETKPTMEMPPTIIPKHITKPKAGTMPKLSKKTTDIIPPIKPAGGWKIPPLPAIPFIPSGGLFGEKRTPKKRTKRKYKYTPSAYPTLFEIRGKVTPTLGKTGLGVRPIPIKIKI